MKGLKSLLTNPVFVLASFGSAMDGYLSSGLMTFGPKILEERFHKTSGAAAFQSGLVAVPGAVLGSFAGGLIAKVEVLYNFDTRCKRLVLKKHLESASN